MKIDILGVQIDNLTFAQTLAKVETLINEGGAHYIVTPYAESIVRAQQDQEFREIINKADLAVPDGISLLMAAKYLQQCNGETTKQSGQKRSWQRSWPCLLIGLKTGLSVFFNRSYFDVIPETVKGTDLTAALCVRAAEKGWKVMFLGGWHGAAERAAKIIKQQYPNLTIDSMAGSDNVTSESEEAWANTKARLSQFRPNLLFVSYGPVRQEKWITHHLSDLSTNVVIGVAGAFDMLSGLKPRAPLFMRGIGLEWLWRLWLEPLRLKRILTAFPYFPLLVFRRSLVSKD